MEFGSLPLNNREKKPRNSTLVLRIRMQNIFAYPALKDTQEIGNGVYFWERNYGEKLTFHCIPFTLFDLLIICT